MPQLRNIPETTRPALESRHLPSGLNSQFSGDQLSFPDYVESCRKMLFKAHSGNASGNASVKLEKAVDGNAPFELRPSGNFPAGRGKPYRRGVLLIHGLTDSPYFMRPLAEFFRNNGFRVMAILLPGHGTQPGDLLEVRWQEWARAVAYGTDQMAAEAEEIYLAGFSAGGTLGINQSLRDDRVRGLFLFSPALRISPLAAWANLHKLYSWLIPSAKWVGVKPDRDLYKYESFPKNAASQMYTLTRMVNAQLRKQEMRLPIFAAASLDDTTVDTSGTLEFMAQARHPSCKLVLYATDAARLPCVLTPEKLERINSAIPGKKILSSSHMAIVIPPEDAHYGMAGDYANFIHYYPDDMEKYNAGNNPQAGAWQGEITEQNLKTGLLRRLMYNPHFAALQTSMQKFIESLP